ncbi:peptidase A2A, partial [mine drainage metagenome]
MATSFLKALSRMLCLAALLPAVALAAQSSAPAPKRAGPDHTSSLRTAPTRLDRIGQVVVSVMIDGKGPFRFLVDTGADGSMISARLARKLGLVSPRNSGERVEGTTGTERMPWVRIARMRIGSIVKTDLRMPIAQSPVMTGLDGILGMAGFGPVRVAVDFQHDTVAIGPSRRGPMWGYLDIRAKRTAGGLLEIPARVGGVRCEAVIDTGAEETLGNFALRNALLRNAAKKAALADVYGVTKQISTGGLAHSPTLLLGPAAIRNLTIVYSDIP